VKKSLDYCLELRGNAGKLEYGVVLVGKVSRSSVYMG